MTYFFIVTLNGLTLAALYFLASSGFTLIFGFMRTVNMAHGALLLLGGYVGFSVVDATGSWSLGLIGGGLASAFAGAILQAGVLGWMQGDELRQTLASIAISIIMADFMLWYWGGITYQVELPQALSGGQRLPLLGVGYANIRLALMGFALIVGIALWLFISRTRLIEQDGVDIIVGPLSGSEGLALRDLSKSYPGVTFINGSSAVQDTTLRGASDNFFRFGGDGAQWMVGVGDYAFNELGYKTVAVVAEDYSFPYTQALGFMSDYCEAGGKVPEKFWTPIGNKDYSSIVYSIPKDVDAIFVALGGADAVNFLTQYDQAGGDKPIIGGSITIDQSILDSKGPFKKLLIGAPSGTPTVSDYDGEEWKVFSASYTEAFPDGFSAPSIFAHHYYMNAKAAMLALDEVDADLSDNHASFRAVLSDLKFVTPTGGTMRLDENRNGIIDTFITEVFEREDGSLGNRVVKVVRDVNQTLGQDKEAFLAAGPVSRDNPSCP